MGNKELFKKFQDEIKLIVSGKKGITKENKVLFIKVPKEGLDSSVIKITIEAINEIVQDLWMKTFFAKDEMYKDDNGDFQFRSLPNSKRLDFQKVGKPNKNQNIVAISLFELNFSKDYDLNLYARWWTLKEPNPEQIINIEELDSYYNSKITLGDVKEQSFQDLFEYTKDYKKIEKQFSKFSNNEQYYISYLIEKELFERIKNTVTESNFSDDSYISKINPEDLYFSTELLPFNFNGSSHVLNKIQGQGETLFNIITFDELWESFPEIK